MKNNILLLVSILILITSCNTIDYKSENEFYNLEIEELTNYHSNYTNKIQQNPLNLNAERIKLKDFLAVILGTDVSNIKIKNKNLESKSFRLIINQKDEKSEIKKSVIRDLEKVLDIKIKAESYKSYKLSVNDSIKFLTHKSNAKNSCTKIVKVNQDIEIENLDLKEFSAVLNSEFNEEISANEYPVNVDYKWKNQSFDDTKKLLSEEWGLLFTDLNNEKKIYTIDKN